MTEFEQQVENYILADRQWPRQHRMAHAKMMLSKAYDEDLPIMEWNRQMNFWRAVLQRNED